MKTRPNKDTRFNINSNKEIEYFYFQSMIQSFYMYVRGLLQNDNTKFQIL